MTKKRIESHVEQMDLVKQLIKTIDSAVESWRLGNDSVGLSYFIKGLNQLKVLLQEESVSDAEDRKTKWHAFLREMHFFIKNRDLIGLTDFLQFTLIPFISEWRKEVNDHGTAKK